MKIDINIDPNCQETKITIRAPKITEDLQQILNLLNSSNTKKHVICNKNEKIYILNPEDIFFFYSENRKVFVQTKNDLFEIKERLYELENIFKDSSFVRISKSVIANVDKIKNLEMLFNGSMKINFINGKDEFISRKYVPNIKKFLNIGGK